VDEPRGPVLGEPYVAVTFDGFFRAEYPTLVRGLFLLIGDVDLAEEIAQEAMARVCERWDRVKAMDSPGGYMWRTAVNLNHKRMRSLRVRLRWRPEQAMTAPDATPSVDSRLDVRSALVHLPAAQREALVLVEWLGWSVEMVADRLDIEPVSVRGRLHRARQNLRRALGGEIDGSA
jgi:RNA polymerase sigma factor (sigma-70 family)